MENIGTKIKQLRLEKKMTQLDLAKRIGISKTTMCHWEIGRQEPSIRDIKKICIIFDVTADYLIGLEDETGRRTYNISNTINDNHGTINQTIRR